MRGGPCVHHRGALLAFAAAVVLPAVASAQSKPQERSFAQPKSDVERALTQMQPFLSGRLPALDGFVIPDDRPLDRFQHGYFQCTVQVQTSAEGQSLAKVQAKITAWYADPQPSKAAYAVLPSNGRLESDVLDRLSEKLADSSVKAGSAFVQAENKHQAATPAISAPAPGPTASVFSSAAKKTAGSPFQLESGGRNNRTASPATQKAVADKQTERLTAEAKNLEEVLRNQAHPDNLAAVKKTGAPVLASPSEGAKVLFLASAEDEFEILDMNASWVHVRISGLSRGWIQRSKLEMPGASAAAMSRADASLKADGANSKPFQVEREQMASFPGNWEPLRGKTVKIVSIQKNSTSAPNPDSEIRLKFAKSMFDTEFTELKNSSSSAAGVVLIFDSEDGGMIAATLPVLQLWKAGSLSDEAFWRRCFFDPPEMLPPASAGGQ